MRWTSPVAWRHSSRRKRDAMASHVGKECCEPGCTIAVFSYGRCNRHYWKLKREQPAEVARLSAMTYIERNAEYDRVKHPPLPSWQYENPQGEAELMAAQEQLWKEKREKYLASHDVPMLTSWFEVDQMVASQLNEENENG
jgi:hypothetical protein